MTETALLVEVPEIEHLAEKWRTQYDPVAVRGVPAHITALFPFAPTSPLDPPTIERIQKVLTSMAPFEFRLVQIDEFPNVIWLRPEPDHAFRRLTTELWNEFPEYPPYEGRHPVSQPHVTLAMSTGDEQHAELRREIESDLGPHLPVTCRAEALSVFVNDDRPVWTRHHRLPFGG
jgi:2'-5' RNA ligase